MTRNFTSPSQRSLFPVTPGWNGCEGDVCALSSIREAPGDGEKRSAVRCNCYGRDCIVRNEKTFGRTL